MTAPTQTPQPRKVPPKAVVGGAALAALMAAAVAVEPFTAAHEGKRNVGYHDIAHPTDARFDAICYGHTQANAAGARATDAQCGALLTSDEQKAARAIAPCLPATPLPPGVARAFVDVAYNLGSGAFCQSSMSRKALAGDLPGACAAISLYAFSGGKDCRLKASNCGGIVTRRADQRALCESGLKAPSVAAPPPVTTTPHPGFFGWLRRIFA